MDEGWSDMRVEEFEKLTRKRLREKANECFDEMKTAGHEQRPGLLLQAQFYLNGLDHRYESARSHRELILELIIIGLIGLELREGHNQAKVLDRMDTSTAATVTAVQTLQKAQLDSLKTQKDSLQMIGEMNGAIADQLKIVKTEQAERRAQQNSRPVLELRARSFEIGTGFRSFLIERDNAPLVHVPRQNNQTYAEVVF
jgi:hypothetical protein